MAVGLSLEVYPLTADDDKHRSITVFRVWHKSSANVKMRAYGSRQLFPAGLSSNYGGARGSIQCGLCSIPECAFKLNFSRTEKTSAMPLTSTNRAVAS
ncbi:unnamed protein product [Leptosia nina]|uniref:Uncharacterized protein n=1 Tax=Leptosia nina TaxID=320188 RepID=A0AAV1IY86_9NEOP